MYDGQAAVLEAGLVLDDPQLFQSPLAPVAVAGLLAASTPLPQLFQSPFAPVAVAGLPEVVFLPSAPLPFQLFQSPADDGLLGSHEPQVVAVVVLLPSAPLPLFQLFQSPPFGLVVVDGLLGSQSAHVLDDFMEEALLGSHDPQVAVVVGSAGLLQFSQSFEADLYGQLV